MNDNRNRISLSGQFTTVSRSSHQSPVRQLFTYSLISNFTDFTNFTPDFALCCNQRRAREFQKFVISQPCLPISGLKYCQNLSFIQYIKYHNQTFRLFTYICLFKQSIRCTPNNIPYILPTFRQNLIFQPPKVFFSV